MHADEIITHSLTFKREFGTGQFLKNSKSEAEFIMSNELRCYVEIIKLRRQSKFQINSAKHIATEFIMSNKLRCASPTETLSKISLLCKQKSSRINRIT